MMIAMDRETLLEELDRLLDAGEPLLNVFPRQHPNDWSPQLPDNISPEMRMYAGFVAFRADDRKDYWDYWQQHTTGFLTAAAKKSEAGLLG